ncbi:lasso peptide biosynthesis B2 protein [Sphingomonas sp.]|jgi:hypothetical protein|uniref:lasso peptide biosynthesis B2 protein n=1 Tax=Sphingomonas sp. TaxID=28214 RepID=UPI002EDA5D75
MWRLNSNLTACIASGRLILLDEARDRYSAVPDDSVAFIEAWLSAADGSDVPAPLARMLGDTSPGRLTNQLRIDVSAPNPTAGQPAGTGADLTSVFSVTRTILASWSLLRTRKLHRILAHHRGRRTAATLLEPSALVDCAQRFANARRWCPMKRNCLLDSLALDRWMEHPRNAEIVFGVVAKPFEAHCWVQSEATVLNDSYDRVSRFEPILTV